MVPSGDLTIRRHRVRGNYVNSRRLHSKVEARLAKRRDNLPDPPGYFPPVADLNFPSGTTKEIAVREIDLPFLSQDDWDQAGRHLWLILCAREGDSHANRVLSDVLREQGRSLGKHMVTLQPVADMFAVPCTSSNFYSEQDISHKGSVLLRLSQLGYPVPDFAILTAPAYREGDAQLETHLRKAIEQLQNLTSARLGDAMNPLVIAIRCCMPHYMPGVMQTFLNVGVTEETLPALERIYGPLAARKMFLNNLRNIYLFLKPEEGGCLARNIRADLSAEELLDLIEQFANLIGKTDRQLLKDAFVQAAFFSRQAYKHYEEIKELLVTLSRGKEYLPSLILQKMICTVRHDDSYVGVLSSRHSQTGVGVELQSAHNIFGEEIMTGTREIDSSTFVDREVIRNRFPAIYHFTPSLRELESEFGFPITIEFAVEATERYQWFALLQLNETGMAGQAAILSAVEMQQSGIISRKRVSEIIRPYHIKQLTSDTIDPVTYHVLAHFSTGVAVLPRSAVSARIFFTEDAALDAKKRGENVCFCKTTFVPTDTVVMNEVDAIVSLTSAAIHVVTICQSLGVPALLSLEKFGVQLKSGGRLVNAYGTEIHEGDWITISSLRKSLYQGKAKFKPARLLRYMQGEPVELEEEEQERFAAIAYAYRFYKQLMRGLKLEQISTLDEVVNLVNLELRGETEQAKKLVNGWFDDRESVYIDEIFKSEVGDHLSQSRVFEMLSMDRRIRFFQKAIARCFQEKISGYAAGAFMLGRFLSLRYPVVFWKSFSAVEIGLLVNEWVLFEKYMQVLQNVGERKVIETRKKILRDGLDDLYLHSGTLKCLIPLKLCGAPLDKARALLPEWTDSQAAKVLDLLQQPYRAFYDFDARWSVAELEKICAEANIPVPKPDDI